MWISYLKARSGSRTSKLNFSQLGSIGCYSTKRNHGLMTPHAAETTEHVRDEEGANEILMEFE